MNLNKVMIAGNLVQDPSLRDIGDGNKVCNCRIATNRHFKTKSGESRQETLYLDFELWGRNAENFDKYMEKGRPVYLEGHLKTDGWEDKETGQKRSKTVMSVSNFQFINGSKDQTAVGAGSTTSSKDNFDDEDIPF